MDRVALMYASLERASGEDAAASDRHPVSVPPGPFLSVPLHEPSSFAYDSRSLGDKLLPSDMRGLEHDRAGYIFFVNRFSCEAEQALLHILITCSAAWQTHAETSDADMP